MTWRPAGPLGLLGRILAILLVTILFEFGASTLLYERASRVSLHEDEAHRIAEQLVVTRKLVSGRPLADRPALARLLSSERYELRWRGSEPPRELMTPDLELMTRQVVAWEPTLADGGLNLRLASVRGRQLVAGSVRLRDGSWIEFVMHEAQAAWSIALNRILLALVPVVALFAIGSLLIRGTLRPLRTLAAATARIGYGEPVHLDEAGTAEVRALIRAYNDMQDRIHSLVEGRTQALAAVGHDLRTPVARLGLRAEAIADAGLRREVEGDLGEIEGMLASLLAFLGGEDDPETPARVDLAVMAATIAQDFEDRGYVAIYAGPDHHEVRVRVGGIRRALTNLVENAIVYGGRADVSLSVVGEGVAIAVEDDGPGIPEERMAEVRQPFMRLDAARARNTGGLGLGLAIVQQTVEREGGELRLANRAPGGLRAEIRLPPN